MQSNQLSLGEEFENVFTRRKDYKFNGRNTDFFDRKVTWRTRKKDVNKWDLTVRIGDAAMKEAGFKAGDRVSLYQSNNNRFVVALVKDPNGAKLCPQGLTGDEYYKAIEESIVMTCSVHVTIYVKDNLPITANISGRCEWQGGDNFLKLKVPTDTLSGEIETEK